MARRKPSTIETADLDDRALERRLRNLWLGSAPYMGMDKDTPNYATEKAVAETIAAADNRNRKASLSDRVELREDLLASMGRLDRALRHCRAMDATRERWGTAR